MYDEEERLITNCIPVMQEGFFANLSNAQRVSQYIKTGVEPDVWEQGQIDIVDAINRFKEGSAADWSMYRIFNPDDSSLFVYDYYVKNDLYKRSAFYGAPPASLGEYMPILTDLETQIVPQIVLGILPPEAFDDFVEQWKSLGGDQVTKDINEIMSNR
jgi:putative aldouronate transport system substrate-binding protein